MDKKYYAVVLLALSLGMIAPAAAVSAATQGRQPVSSAATDADIIKPEFATSAEALRAANHAKEAVNSKSTLKQSLANVKNAQDTLNKAVNNKDRDAINRANQALSKAEETYTTDLADITGVSNKDIRAIHDTGMSWGEVAHELGVHADLVGFDHTRDDAKHSTGMSKQSSHPAGIDPDELNEATARNMSSGWSRGHSAGVQSGSGFTGDTVGISGAGGVRHGVDASGNRTDAHDNIGKDSLSGNLGELGGQHESNSYGDSSGSGYSSGRSDSESHGGSVGSDGSGGSGGSGGSSGSGSDSGSGHGGGSDTGGSGSGGSSGHGGGSESGGGHDGRW